MAFIIILMFESSRLRKSSHACTLRL